jgi:nitrogen-specific signal transduction histidine kinase
VLDRIRKPYFTTKEGGSGLGVAVARGLVEQHGGMLLFDSAPGRGTTVTLDLPICALKMCAGALPNPFKKTDKPAEVASSAEAPAR